MAIGMGLEFKIQTATQDYDCDGCGQIIPEETKYLRVAVLDDRGRSKNTFDGGVKIVPSASIVEKFHEGCWELEK